MASTSKRNPASQLKVAIIGAGLAGLTAARTLVKAGHDVTVFEKSRGLGGRMASRRSDFGNFDHGAQYFTVRDDRFRTLMQWALDTAPNLARPWGANAIRVLDATGNVQEDALPKREPHWVGLPGMSALAQHIGAPLIEGGQLKLMAEVTKIERQGETFSVHTINPAVPASLRRSGAAGMGDATHSNFDALILALPHVQALSLLNNHPMGHNVSAHLNPQLMASLGTVTVAPCWTMMLAFPNALPIDAKSPVRELGPQWNAARSTHHRIAWLARENSKPGHGGVERWTVQASADWSKEHLEDAEDRVKGKLLKAFGEVTGIRAEPGFVQLHRWRFAKTQNPLGKSHVWEAGFGLGLCGDWCLGHRVENAFVSGLELALAVIDSAKNKK